MKSVLKWKIDSGSAFDVYYEKWDRLNESGPNSPVLNAAFISCALKAFGYQGKIIAILESDSKVMAMAILEKNKLGVWDTYQPSQAPLGFWINQSQEPLAKLLKSLAKTLPGIVLKIGLTQQDPDIYPRPIDEKNISTLDYIDTARIDVEGSFDEYWAARGKNLRHNLKRQRNRLRKENIETKLQSITDPDLVCDAVISYGTLESSGWKSAQGTAIHSSNNQGKFYISLLKSFCSRGKGIIYQYTYNNRIVASDICIVQGETFVILKTTYDEEIKTSSPAFLMRQEVFERLFNQTDVSSIEFYGKVMGWHSKWSSDIRKMYHLNYDRLTWHRNSRNFG